MATTTEVETRTDSYLTCPRGLTSWLLTLDHKRIGLMFLVLVSVSLALGATFGLLIRTELTFPGGQVVSSGNAYNRLFTLHGAVMIFLFVLPGLASAFGNFVLPLMLGAKDVAFPRLNLASLYWHLVDLIWIYLFPLFYLIH